MRNNYIKTDELCSYMQFMDKRKVYATNIMQHFNIKNRQNLIRRLKKISCMKVVSESVLGSTKKIYRVTHSDTRHTARKTQEYQDKQVSESVGAWGGDFAKYKREIEPHLKRSEKFDPALDFEVHGLRWMSPYNETLPNMEGIFDIDVKWTWCDFHVNANDGRLLVFTKPNKHFAKYGLNKVRYDEFIEFRDNYLKDKFGYSAGLFLEPVQFDLHQDDWRYEFKGSWEGTDIIAGEVDQYKLTLQRYGVVRKDRPEDTPQTIKRFEVRFKTLKTVAHLGDIIPHALSLDADRVTSIANLEAYKQEARRERQLFIESTKVLLNSIAGITEKTIDVETVVQQIRDLSDSFDYEATEQSDFRIGQTEIMRQNTIILDSMSNSNIQIRDGIEILHEDLEDTRSDFNRLIPQNKIKLIQRIKRLVQRKSQ